MNKKDQGGDQALLIALESQDDVHAANSVGTTALSLAKRRAAQGYKRADLEQIVKLLALAGATR